MKRFLSLLLALAFALSVGVDARDRRVPIAAAAGGGGITQDATSAESNSFTETLSFSHTIGGGSNRLLICGVSTAKGVGILEVTGITYNTTQNFTEVTGAQVNNGTRMTTLYYLKEADMPSAGTYSVVVTVDSASGVQIAGCVSYSGVHQSTTFGTAGTNSGNGTAPTVDCSSASGEVVVGTARGFGSASVSTSDTELWEEINTDTTSTAGVGASAPGAGSVTIDWTGFDTDDWTASCVPIKPA